MRIRCNLKIIFQFVEAEFTKLSWVTDSLGREENVFLRVQKTTVKQHQQYFKQRNFPQ